MHIRRSRLKPLTARKRDSTNIEVEMHSLSVLDDNGAYDDDGAKGNGADLLADFGC